MFPNPETAAAARVSTAGRGCSSRPSRARCSFRSGRAGAAESLQRGAWWTTRGKVAFRNVKVGPRVESLWVIEDGLKAGERVVVEGLQRDSGRRDGQGRQIGRWRRGRWNEAARG